MKKQIMILMIIATLVFFPLCVLGAALDGKNGNSKKGGCGKGGCNPSKIVLTGSLLFSAG